MERWNAYQKRVEMGRVKDELGAAVKAGRITEAQAKERWEGYLKRFRGDKKQKTAATPSREEMAKVKEKIWAAVRAGKVTEAQAEDRWQAYLKHVKNPEAKRR